MKTWKDIEGWFNFQQIYDSAVETGEDGDVFIEIGSYKGKSAAYMGQAIKDSGKRITLLTSDIDEGLSRECKENIYECSLTRHVSTVWISSKQLSSEISECGFVFIDGDHSYRGVNQDISLWYPKVKTGRIFAGHDYHSDPVKKAVDKFAAEYDYKLSFVENSWYVIKK
ncbi:MAG: hypothetical protein COA65_09660 [Rhodospirillaceae bacterium]|nr:MAG: hypothetical protein COA65_09660 [Rhodospirillaceae bacterium]